MTIPDGLHTRRLQANADNPREIAFSDQWRREHEHHDLLGLLFSVPCAKDDPEVQNGHALSPWSGYYKLPLGTPTERDRVIAATLIQWLGSNIGMGLIEQALEKCGYKIVRK
jgi:hypothetical protein